LYAGHPGQGFYAQEKPDFDEQPLDMDPKPAVPPADEILKVVVTESFFLVLLLPQNLHWTS
jgi:hypothetical protein